MAKYFDKDGKEVEAYSEEEFETKKTEILDQYAKENPDKSEDLLTAQNDLAVATSKLKEFEEGAGGDDGKGGDEQKKRLLAEKKEAEEAVKAVTDNLTQEIKDLKDGFFGGAKSKVISKLAGDDAELKAKIELEYDGFAGEPKNEIEIQERMAKAFTLATGNTPAPNFMDGMSNASPKGNGDGGEGAKTPETSNSKAMRGAFGISDQDAEKYAPDNIQVK